MKKTTKKIKKVDKKDYIAEVKILGKYFSSEGTTSLEAITNLKPLGMAKGVALISVTKAGVTREKILTPMQTFRLFNGGRIMREVALKNTSLLFDGL